jgi:hypothetical protein
MIRVHTADEPLEFPDAIRFSTEEQFNNLCIWTGDKGQALLAVFADGKWVWVEAVVDG